MKKTDERILAENLYEWMKGLKGSWVVHESEFLPANVTCDYAGKQCFINGIAEVIKQHRKEQK